MIVTLGTAAEVTLGSCLTDSFGAAGVELPVTWLPATPSAGSALLGTLFVTDVKCDGGSNFTVMRGIGGVANDES